jgi:hypothetical protein
MAAVTACSRPRDAHRQGLVGPLVVIARDEGVEAGLLLSSWYFWYRWNLVR